ncbi:MAG: VWA domain-containing protein, partial [SAR324 cluster bacterium]|nr:VWA domain-containing protein [SAR324 cluster bacterium]
MEITALSEFHFLRVEWLWLLPLWGLVLWFLPKIQSSQIDWAQWIAPPLQRLFVVSSQISQHRKKQLQVGFALIWILGTLALAGPAWERFPKPLLVRDQARVILLDLSYSMLATDLQPNRLERARYKIEDLLNRFQEGQTAIVLYAGDAHTLVPLTEDVETIRTLLPSLHPSLMPVRGSRPDLAFENVIEMLNQVDIQNSHLVWITDGIDDQQVKPLQNLLSSQRHKLTVLAVGTPSGAPIVLEKGNYLKDTNNNIVIPQLDLAPLRAVAEALGGQVLPVQYDDSDLERLVASEEKDQGFQEQEEELTTDRWREEGPWLFVLLLPSAAMIFRRGWLFVLVLTSWPSLSEAWEWRDLFINDNQRAYELLEEGQAAEAAQTFEDSTWQGIASYKAQEYEAALQHWSNEESPITYYNRGNALARNGKLPEALQAYDQALAAKPDWEDAQFNRDLVAKLLDSQQKQPQEDRSSGGNPNQSEEGEEDSQEQPNQAASSGNSTEENQLPENNDAADGDSASNNQQSAEQAPKPDDSQGSEDSTGQLSEQNSDQKSTGSASGKETTDSENLEKTGQKESQKDPVTPQEGNESEEEEQSDQAAAYLNGNEKGEQEQMLQQWLRKVPDDPGQLLRNKMRLESLRRRQASELNHETDF